MYYYSAARSLASSSCPAQKNPGYAWRIADLVPYIERDHRVAVCRAVSPPSLSPRSRRREPIRVIVNRHDGELAAPEPHRYHATAHFIWNHGLNDVPATPLVRLGSWRRSFPV